MNGYEDILVSIDDAVAVITLNRPKVLNAMRMQTKRELEDAINKFERDDNIRGIIITGEGRAFGAGSDIQEMDVDRNGAETTLMSSQAHLLMNRIENLSKPVIAAINGYALGGGLELALACDMRVMSTKAKVGVPEVELGVAPCYGGTQRLPRLVGPSRAMDMLLTGRKVGAAEALQMGLADRIAEPEKLLDETMELMKAITTKAPKAVAGCKKCVHVAMESSLEDGLRYEAELAGELAETEDAKEGIRAFMEKREPVFKNR